MTNPIDFEAARTALGMSTWQAFADALGVHVRRIHRWRRDGVPAEDAGLVRLALDRLVERRPAA